VRADKSIVKRAVVAAHDFVYLLAFACMALAATPGNAWAYVDPSVMTYTIQAVAGVAVALSAVAGVAFRRTRKVIMKALRIDENANKESDPELTRLDAQASKEFDEHYRAEHAGNRGDSTGVRVPFTNPSATFKQRLPIAAVFAGLFVFTVFVVPPIEIVGGNSDSLTFGLGEVGWLVVVFGVVVFALLTLVLSALKGKAFTVGACALLACSIGAYVQALFLNTGLPIADGANVMWLDYKRITLLSTVVWAAIIAAVVLLVKKGGNRVLKPFLAVSLTLVFVQAVGVGSVVVEAANAQGSSERVFVTKDGMYDLSRTGNNVVVIILDAYDNIYIRDILKTDPQFLEPLSDFTYFSNTTGSMIPTRYGVPFLLTGSELRPDETVDDYYRNRYARSSFVKEIHDAGYSVGLYTDTLLIDGCTDPEVAKDFYSQTINLHPLENPNIDYLGAIGALEQLSLYRDAPWLAKPLFWFFTSDLNNRMVDTSGTDDLGNVQYLTDDAGFRDELNQRGIEPVDDGTAGSFRFIHLLGAHYPFSMDENGNTVPWGTTAEQQARGSMRIVFDYVDRLKEAGLYDNTTIILTTDHGRFYETRGPIQEPAAILMMVKPAKGAEDALGARDYAHYVDGGACPCKVSDMPVRHGDFQATVMAAIGVDTDKYGPTLFEVDDPHRVRYYIMTTYWEGQDYDLLEFKIDGDANDMANWHLTGKSWQRNPWPDA